MAKTTIRALIGHMVYESARVGVAYGFGAREKYPYFGRQE
jgi:hypothetical protein